MILRPILALLLLTASLQAIEFRNLGPQIQSTTMQGGAFTTNPQGHLLACSVLRGEHAHLAVFDVSAKKFLKDYPLPGEAQGAWNLTTASDGTVYIGTDPMGHLYRWKPGDEAVTDCGQAPPEQTWIWDLTPGQAGEVFLATYPGCRILRYHPADGFKEISNGPAAPGESYARTLARDPKTGKIYIGVGSHAHLIELNPKTGEKRDLLPREYADIDFVYSVKVLGDRLFAYLTNHGKSLIFNLRTGKLEGSITGMNNVQVLAKSPDDDRIYYVFNGQLRSFDAAHPDKPPVDLMPHSASALAMTWDDPDVLVIFGRYGGVVRYNTKTRQSTSFAMKPPSLPVIIQSTELGPDGRIWVGGYLSGGAAAYDPATDKSEQFGGISQPEDMTSIGTTMYFGIYPGARLVRDDTSKPWKPHEFGAFGKDGQSRPMAMLGVAEVNRLFVGTVPEYGHLGGMLIEHDVAADKNTMYPNIIRNQSIVSLVYSDGVVIGGSSIQGGLGQEPSEKEAKLFIWDPSQHEVVWEGVPVEGAASCTGLFVGPDRNIWGMGRGTLFIFDVKDRKVIERHELFPDNTKGPSWRGAYFVTHPSGQIYCTATKRLFRLDPKTKQVEVLRANGEPWMLTMDRDGRLYFREKADLWQCTP